ncbi:MAG: hypothetical protein PUA73_04895 [Bacilli bacterium]|nr:hypothetical protein [Bacilli bacterium]
MNRTQKNYIILGLSVIVLIMAVGYAAFSSQLKISGTSSVTSSWDVEITNIESTNVIGSATNGSAPTYTKTTATFNTNLVSPGDSITYDVTVENKGSIDATLKTITKTDTNNSAILFETSGIKEGDSLLVGAKAHMLVKVTYNQATTSQPKNLTSTLKVTLDYVQKSSSTVTPSTSLAADKLKENVVTTGDGLYADTTEEGRYIYRGANPNNYITLGSDMYRIISVESDNTIKVIKNGCIDDKVFDDEYARYSTNSTDYCNSEYGCKVWGSKTTTYDKSGNNVTQMPREVGGTLYNLPDKEASLNTYLNNDWYNSLSSNVQNLIVSHMFNVGVTNKNETSLANTINQEQTYKWKGKVGLMNPSDYVKASTNSVCDSVYAYRDNPSCFNSSETYNWIFASLGFIYSWTIAPCSDSYADCVFGVHSGGRLSSGNADFSASAAPVLYLSSDISLEGEGTSNSPYTVG